MPRRWTSKLLGPTGQCAFGSAGLVAVSYLCFQLQLSLGTAGFIFLILLTSLSLIDNIRVFAVLSIVALASLNYFFARPLFSLWIDNPQDAVALAAFLAILLIVASLRAKRRRAAAALERSEMYLAEAQRISHTGSFGWNSALAEVFWSEETFRIFDFDPDTRPTLARILERTHPDDRALVQGHLDRGARGAPDWQFEQRLLMPDGTLKYLRVVARDTTVADDTKEPRLPQFIGAVMDVTAIKQSEEARRQAQAELSRVNRIMLVGELTASIAHEVNQPIAASVMNANACLRWLAAQPPDLSEARDALQRIVRDGNRAGDVIRRIRTMIKKTPPKRDRLDVNETLLEVVAMTQGEIQSHDITLETLLSRELPLVQADRVQIQQIVLNLIINAIEAMDEAAGSAKRLTIASEQGVADDVLVEVRDTGEGLDPANLERLFESFYTTKNEGMGMGLAISRSIVEAHGGRLWATPNEPHGAVFRFTLPVD